MSKIPHIPVCAMCKPHLDIYMAYHFLKQDGLCANHSLEYDFTELLRECGEVIEYLEVRRTISMIYRIEVRRREKRAGVSWLRSDETIRRELSAEFKQLFGEYFDA